MPIPAGPGQDPADLAPELSTVVGDPRRPELAVSDEDGNPGDGTTVATLTVTAPGSAPTAVPVTNLDGGNNWVATQPYTFTNLPGRWVETWTVTGRGADVLYAVVLVHAAPTAGGQTWIPTREQVAAYVPKRTHVGSTTGYGSTLGTFTNDTKPSSASVDSLISQAAQWIELLAGPITTVAVVDGARTAAAMRVAGWIEMQWGTAEDQAHGKLLLGEAEKLRKDVAAGNVAETGEDPTAAPAVMPHWSFPSAPADCVPW